MVLLHWAGGLHCGYCLGNLSSAHSVRSARLYTASMSGGQLLASVPGATSTTSATTTGVMAASVLGQGSRGRHFR